MHCNACEIIVKDAFSEEKSVHSIQIKRGDNSAEVKIENGSEWENTLKNVAEKLVPHRYGIHTNALPEKKR